MITRYCSACFCQQTFHRGWRALTATTNGDLLITDVEGNGADEWQRPNTALACGEASALLLAERYLHTGGFQSRWRSGNRHDEHFRSERIWGREFASREIDQRNRSMEAKH